MAAVGSVWTKPWMVFRSTLIIINNDKLYK